ncbi:hypothetical protein HYS28_01735 [Candidatus Uhrbacteria bacterium]|nr:hypothetical protein [Candidatus Uhrbacteria bacterium]
MAAETGMNIVTATRRVRKLADNAIDLIEDNRRTPAEIKAILNALQAFKEGKLVGIMLADTSDRTIALCSTRIEDTALADEDMKYIVARGVRYVGEICYLNFGVQARPRQIEARIKAALGLPMRFDPLRHDWKPPYWSDESFWSALGMPCVTYFGDYSPAYYDLGLGRREKSYSKTCTLARKLGLFGAIYNMASFLRCTQERGKGKIGSALDLETVLGRPRPGLLWAMAIIPPTWLARPTKPERWIEEEREIEQEIAKYETPRAWVVSWVVDDVTAGFAGLWKARELHPKRAKLPPFWFADGKVHASHAREEIPFDRELVDHREHLRSFHTESEAQDFIEKMGREIVDER